jgi:hypothetical protein
LAVDNGFPISSFHYGIIAPEIGVGGNKNGKSSKAEVAAQNANCDGGVRYFGGLEHVGQRRVEFLCAHIFRK